jgi:hypothetical protein
LKELARSYLTISKDLGRVMSRLKAIYRSWGIPCAGKQAYAPRYRSEWLGKIEEAGPGWISSLTATPFWGKRCQSPEEAGATQ